MKAATKLLLSSLLGALALAVSFAGTQNAPIAPISWMDPNKTEPAGTKYRAFHSRTINSEVSYLIYLPPGYETASEKRYPVLYWLHGRGGNQRGCAVMVSRLDAAIKAGKAPAMIVVGVNGLPYSSYVDSADGKSPVQSVIVKDLIAHVDASYRTVARREARAIEGMSMGGAGAVKIGFKYPELFGVVSSLGGALHDVESIAERGATFQDIYGGSRDYFQAHSPWTLAEKNADAIRGKTKIRFLIGDQDGLLSRNRAYHALLEKLRIPHEFEVVAGAKHNAGQLYDGLGDRAFAFYAQAFATTGKAARDKENIAP
jgi:endo-1,4-beta-xylanase